MTVIIPQKGLWLNTADKSSDFDHAILEELIALYDHVNHLMEMVAALPNQAGDALLERPRHITIAYAGFWLRYTVMLLYVPRDDLCHVVDFDVSAPPYYLHTISYYVVRAEPMGYASDSWGEVTST